MMKKLGAGFTLIEMLIVIGLLGILAAGLLAAIDPFEQLKKGQDTNRRSLAVEVQNSLIRYYATHGEFPWCVGGAGTCTLNGGVPTLFNEGTMTASVWDLLVKDGELKGDDGAEFLINVGQNGPKMYMISTAPSKAYVCFAPESKSVFNDDATKFDSVGLIDGATCPTGGAKDNADIGSCYWCAK